MPTMRPPEPGADGTAGDAGADDARSADGLAAPVMKFHGHEDGGVGSQEDADADGVAASIDHLAEVGGAGDEGLVDLLHVPTHADVLHV